VSAKIAAMSIVSPRRKSFHQNAGIVSRFAKFHRLLGKVGTEPKVSAHHMKGKSPHIIAKRSAFLEPFAKGAGAIEPRPTSESA
jgi:hypothetical protein